MSKTSPCRRATSAAGSTSALEPASSSRGLHTRNFSSTGATTEEIAPGDEADNCNRRENKRVTSFRASRVAVHNFAAAKPEISVATVRDAKNSGQLNRAPTGDYVYALRQYEGRRRTGDRIINMGQLTRQDRGVDDLSVAPRTVARVLGRTYGRRDHRIPDRPALVASRKNTYDTVIVRP